MIHVRDRKEATVPKFEEYKTKLTDELVRSGMNDELDKLIDETSKQLEDAMKTGNESKVESLVKKYNLSFNQGTVVNAFEGNKGSIPMDSSNVFDLLVANPLNSKTIKTFPNAAKTRITLFPLSLIKVKIQSRMQRMEKQTLSKIQPMGTIQEESFWPSERT